MNRRVEPFGRLQVAAKWLLDNQASASTLAARPVKCRCSKIAYHVDVDVGRSGQIVESAALRACLLVDSIESCCQIAKALFVVIAAAKICDVAGELIPFFVLHARAGF